ASAPPFDSGAGGRALDPRDAAMAAAARAQPGRAGALPLPPGPDAEHDRVRTGHRAMPRGLRSPGRAGRACGVATVRAAVQRGAPRSLGTGRGVPVPRGPQSARCLATCAHGVAGWALLLLRARDARRGGGRSLPALVTVSARSWPQ